MSELLEDVMGSRGLSTSQDAGDSARLLEAPGPIDLALVIIPPWWRWQRREVGVALRADLMRMVPPEAVARLALPAVLMRLIAPVPTGVTVVPATTTAASSTAVTTVVERIDIVD